MTPLKKIVQPKTARTSCTCLGEDFDDPDSINSTGGPARCFRYELELLGRCIFNCYFWPIAFFNCADRCETDLKDFASTGLFYLCSGISTRVMKKATSYSTHLLSVKRGGCHTVHCDSGKIILSVAFSRCMTW